MFIKSKIIILLVVLLFSTIGVGVNLAQTDSKTEKIRAKVTKYGIGKKVTVQLQFDEKFKGEISSIEKDSFSVRIPKSNTSKTFTYSEVMDIKKPSYAKWIVIGVVAAVATVAIIALDRRCRNEGNTRLCF
jgi:uncharacterized membrane protein